MVCVVAVFGVVVPYDIDRLGVLRLVGHHHAGQRPGHRTRGVDGPYAGCQAFGNPSDALGVRGFGIVSAEHRLRDRRSVEDRVRIGVVRVVDLVADRPQEDRRVVSVAAHHVRHVALDPLLEKVVRTVEARGSDVPPLDPFALGELPLVGGLVHDQQPQFVAEVVDDGRLGVVAHADGVDPDGAEVFEPTAPHLGRHGGAQNPGVVVQAYALDLHPAAVECEPAVGIEVERAQPGADPAAVDGLSVAQQRDRQGVEIGILRVPPAGIVHAQAQRPALGPLRALLYAAFALRHALPCVVEECGPHLESPCGGVVPLHGELHGDVGPAVGQLFAAVGRAPRCEVDFGRCDDPGVAVDARAGVPAGVRITAVIDPHGEHVVALIKIRCHVVKERDVSVGALPEQVPVEVDAAPVVDAFEIDVVACRGVVDREVLAVPSDASGEVSRAAGQRRRQGLFDRPVVGQSYACPAAVVVCRMQGRGVVSEPEQPLFAALFGMSEAYLRLCGRRSVQQPPHAGRQEPDVFCFHDSVCSFFEFRVFGYFPAGVK